MAGDSTSVSPTPQERPRKEDLPKRIQRFYRSLSLDWEDCNPNLNTDEATTTQVNDAIANTLYFYDESEYQGKLLWRYFKDDFSHWTEATFQQGTANLVRELRDFLREKGVYCTRDGGAVSASLMRVIQETNRSTWPTEGDDDEKRTNIIYNLTSDLEISTSPTFTPRDQSSQSLQNPNKHDNHELIAKKVTELNKLYTDDEKYSGKLYDFFQSKIMLFKDKCQRINMPEEGLAKALPTMLKGDAMAYYLDNLATNTPPFATMATMIQQRFETDNTTQLYWDELRRTTLRAIMAKEPNKSLSDALEDLLQKIKQTYRGIRGPLLDDREMQNTLLSAVTGIPECDKAIYDGASTFEDLASKIRKSIRISEDNKKATAQYHSEAHFVDRQFSNGDNRRSRFTVKRNQRLKPRCYVCQKEGCWSFKHSDKERQQARENWFRSRKHQTTPTEKKWQAFVALCEDQGKDVEDDDAGKFDSFEELINEAEALVAEERTKEEDLNPPGIFQHFTSSLVNTSFFTKAPTPRSEDVLAALQDQAFRHALLKDDPSNEVEKPDDNAFISDDRYSSETFRGILPDTGASGVSSAGFPQVQALQRLQPSLKINEAEKHKVKFGAGSGTTIGVLRMPTILGIINFHVLLTPTHTWAKLYNCI
ncbi:hypothetical protein X797_012339 [Metarhizium robertsii]|uniref:Uncharacterized protein n=1 Tax=Metarhizium robertsii TaxID=568076 RepID=A0A014P082_9HYPO|nr:hypothetical protein X797_012339 [Metarhizium robertsii]